MLKYTYIWVSDTAMLDMDYDFEYRERASVAGPCHVHRNVSRNVLECAAWMHNKKERDNPWRSKVRNCVER